MRVSLLHFVEMTLNHINRVCSSSYKSVAAKEAVEWPVKDDVHLRCQSYATSTYGCVQDTSVIPVRPLAFMLLSQPWQNTA